MKRYIIYLILSVCCSLPCLVQAQTMKVSPTLKKGKVVTYKFTRNIDSDGITTVTAICKYTVTEETADGYVVDAINTDFKVTGGDKMVSQMVAMDCEFINDVNFRFITDKNGRLKSIKNYDEARSKMNVNLDRIVNSLFAEFPEISKVTTKDELKAKSMDRMSESQIIKDMNNGNDIMSLNGKTIFSGAKEEYVDDGMKMKRVFQVSGKKITSTSTLNMTKADLKKFIIDTVEKESPENAEMVKNNIDFIVESDQMKLDRFGKGIYDLADDGWAKTLTVETKIDTFGHKTIINDTLSRQ